MKSRSQPKGFNFAVKVVVMKPVLILVKRANERTFLSLEKLQVVVDLNLVSWTIFLRIVKIV